MIVVSVGRNKLHAVELKCSPRNPLTTEKMRFDNSKAAKWEQYERDWDRYYLQYRTVGDSHVREERAAFNGTTLPVSHPFWDTHYPPNGWNCLCLAVQVRKSSHEQTSEEELSKRTKALAE